MRQQVTNLVESDVFQRAIIGVIIFNALTLGLETSDVIMNEYGDVLNLIDRAVVVIFIGELALRLYAHRLRFFLDPWSVFDFLIVGLALIPATGSLSALRAMRVLRVMRLVSSVRGMKKVVNGLLAAMPGMASIVMLLGLVIYVGAVMATGLYGGTSEHFATLGDSLFTLFQVMTGEAWPDIARDVMPAHPSAWIFFVVFILVSTFVVLNLFTAVIVSAMEPERREEEAAEATVLIELRTLREEIAALRNEMGRADRPELDRADSAHGSGA